MRRRNDKIQIQKEDAVAMPLEGAMICDRGSAEKLWVERVQPRRSSADGIDVRGKVGVRVKAGVSRFGFGFP